MRRLLLLFALLLLSFGCIGEIPYEEVREEQLLNVQQTDIDGDGISDYLVYEYEAVTAGDMRVQRYVMVSSKTEGRYETFDTALTDLDLLVADQSLDQFSKSRAQADSACSNNIGLLNVVCTDVVTCTRLCSGASVKCKKIAAKYDEALTDAMISYVQANNEIRSLILDSRRMVLNLNEATDEERNEYLDKIRRMISKVGEINSNPLYNHPELALCTHSDFGVNYLLEAADKIGTHTTTESGYIYTVVLSVTPVEETSASEIGTEISGISIADLVPATALIDPDEISSMHDLEVSESLSGTAILWNSPRPSREGYLISYGFESERAPDAALQSLETPVLKIKTIDLSGLIPTNYVFLLIYSFIKNFFFALGAAIGFTVSILFLLYNIVILIITMLRERVAGSTFTAGFRKAFGRTDVRWKSDLVVAAIFLIAGFYVSSFIATQPSAPPALLESLDALLKSDMGSVGMILTIIGMVLAYFSAENLVKILILEKAYGMVIRHEKDMFGAKAAKLKERIKELAKLVEEATKDDFDVSREYDVLTSIRPERIDQLSQSMTARNKVVIDEMLNRVDTSISSLMERKRIADENWPKWKEMITKNLEEQNEVYLTSLVTVPASLRNWAFGRYVKEMGAENLVFERDVLKRKKVTSVQLVKNIVNKGLALGILVMKQGRLEVAEFAQGNGTVRTALVLKMKSYAQSLAKNMGQHQPSTFVSIGAKNVIIYTKNRELESVLFLTREKFKETMELWKEKSKSLMS